MITYQTMTENVPGHPGTTIRPYSPTEITEKSKTMHKETKFYSEEHQGGQSPYVYRSAPKNMETKTTVTEKYYHADGNYPNGHGLGDRPDYSGSTIYQSQSPVSETRSRSVNRYEEYRSGRSPSGGRYPDKPDTPTRSYYPRQDTPSTTTIYKFSNTTSTVPPNKNADDHEVLLPKPFPTGVQVCPAKPIANGEGPPKKLEDLMASFSDTEVKESILYYLHYL